MHALAHIAQRVTAPDPAVEVWRMPLAVSATELAQLADLLSRDEQVRAARFQFARDRDRYITGRGMLRVLLGNYLGTAPAVIAFALNPHGKPQLAGSSVGVHFNLTHAGDLAICALARGCTPGVDVESLARTVDHEALARRFFSPRERAEFLSIAPADRGRAFLLAWTSKEAVAKAIGRGLSLAIDQLEVTVDPAVPPRVLHIPQGEPREWVLHRLDAGSAYAATLALHRPPATA